MKVRDLYNKLGLRTDAEVDAWARRWNWDQTSVDGLIEAVGRMTAARGRRMSEAVPDPTGVLKLDRTVTYTPPTSGSAEPEVERLLDHAVGGGAILRDDADDWRRRYSEQPEMTREVLESLPGDPALADLAYAQDDRLKALDRAFSEYLGLDRRTEAREHRLLDADGKAEVDGLPVPVLDALLVDAIEALQDPACRGRALDGEAAQRERLPGLMREALDQLRGEAA